MQELRDLARASEITGFIVDPPQQIADLMQGVNLVIDSYWLGTYRTTFGMHTEGSPNGVSFRTSRLLKARSLDFKWRPAGWKEHCAARGYPSDGHPVIVQVLVRVPSWSSQLFDLPQRVGNFTIRYEYREPCIGFGRGELSPGSRIRQSGGGPFASEGALGGFLKDNYSNELYAVSCGHVLGPEGTEVAPGRIPGTVGRVQHASLPPRASSGSKCNRVATRPTLDFAIAKLTGTTAHSNEFPGLGVVDTVTRISEMTSGDSVAFIGSRTRWWIPGHRRPTLAKVGGLNVWREVMISGWPHCMGDMFTIAPRERQYVRSALARPGDSGSWILSADNGVVSWDGMLLAGDGQDVYCSFAEQVFAACQAERPGLVLN